jgi:thioredoxin 1
MNKINDPAKPTEVDESNFEQTVLRAETPTLVAFGALWSEPCRAMLPVLDQIVTRCQGRAHVYVVDADRNLDLDMWYNVEYLPTLLWFAAGHVRARIVGLANEAAILAPLNALEPPTGPGHP